MERHSTALLLMRAVKEGHIDCHASVKITDRRVSHMLPVCFVLAFSLQKLNLFK